jgi:hypothetical protein
MTFSHKNFALRRAIFFALSVVSLFFLTACHLREIPPDPDIPEHTETFDPDLVVGPPTVSDNPSASPSSTPETKPSPEIEGPDIPKREPVDDEFFSDAAFVGNSLMDGFRLFSGLTTCDYYEATSMTVAGVGSKACITLDNGNAGTILDGIAQKPYGKVYILLGINEIGYEISKFTELYGTMLDSIEASQEDCDIYIMGLTPVSAAKSGSGDGFNMDRINSYNDALRDLAAERGHYYLDLVEALAGDDGFLPSSETTDGVHFSVNIYMKWLDYVKTHYI